MASAKLIRGATFGRPVGADNVGRYLSDEQRSFFVAELAHEAAAFGARLVTEAHAEAALLVEAAEREAGAVRERARQEGIELGRTEGRATVLHELEPAAAVLRRAAD